MTIVRGAMLGDGESIVAEITAVYCSTGLRAVTEWSLIFVFQSYTYQQVISKH
jgi:hypothetical protein